MVRPSFHSGAAAHHIFSTVNRRHRSACPPPSTVLLSFPREQDARSYGLPLHSFPLGPATYTTTSARLGGSHPPRLSGWLTPTAKLSSRPTGHFEPSRPCVCCGSFAYSVASRLTPVAQELETLLEKGVLDDNAFDSIHAILPQESPLSGPLRTTANTTGNGESAKPEQSSSDEPASAPSAFEKLDLLSKSPAPPSYEDTTPPNLPSRDAKPVIAYARALYRYAASDARDVGFEKDDQIHVHEYMNQDWWMGRNVRTGQEGIFPQAYVLVESEKKVQSPYPPEQQLWPPPEGQQPTYGYPPGPPREQNPYDANAPPMAVANGGQPSEHHHGKAEEYGKRFGKRLGHAAIFGAGATLGGKVVNSIF